MVKLIYYDLLPPLAIDPLNGYAKASIVGLPWPQILKKTR